MTVVLVFAVVAFLSIGLLVCVKHDVPHLYLAAKRIVGGLMLAMAAVMTAMLLWVPLTCGDVDPYSFGWYVMFCMGPSH